MPDVAKTADAVPAILEGIMTILELHAADVQQRARLNTYPIDTGIPQGPRVDVERWRSLPCWPSPIEAERRAGEHDQRYMHAALSLAQGTDGWVLTEKRGD